MFYERFQQQKKFNCTSIIIKYYVPYNFKLSNIRIIFRVYETDKYIGGLSIPNFFNTNLCDKEIELLKNEIEEYVKNYKEN